MSAPLGLIGGMAWPSTVAYYEGLNRRYQQVRGGVHSAPLLVWSFDFAEIETLQRAGQWDELGIRLGDVADRLMGAGAGALILCTNTMHKVAESIEAHGTLLHIGDAVASAAHAAGFTTVGLLGTRFTMGEAFYRDRLARAGIDTIVPTPAGCADMDRIIFEELVKGIVTEASKSRMAELIEALAHSGAQAVILGCTELGLLRSDEIRLPVLDSVDAHINAAHRWLVE